MRFFCFLLGSALLHAAFLTLPLSTSTGDAGRNALQPLRVRLLDHGSPRRAAANVEMPQRGSTTDEAARGQVARKRPRTLPRSRARPGVGDPAAPEALGESRANGKAAQGRSIAPAPARKTPDEPGRDRGITGDIEGPPGEAPGRGREPSARPGGETALASLAPDRERGQGPRASTGRGAVAVRTPVRYARVVKPEYPRKARTAGWEGTTVLKVRVDRGGRPGLVTVDRTSGFETLDRAAVRAMRRWEFHPARNGDRTVASWVKVPVSFQLEEDHP